MYNTCKYCHWFSKGKCYKQKQPVSDVSYLVDSGDISDVLEETFCSIKKDTITKGLTNLLNTYKMSKKRTEEVKTLVIELIDQWFDFEVKEEMDCSLSILLQRAMDREEDFGLEINNPDDFSCKYFC